MSLSPGTRLGVYEIVAPIGAGGMGEVFRARDTRLNRDVAIKILPDLLAGDPERRLRFEREAQALGALNHPHIAQIYAVVDLPAHDGDAGGGAIVMELVEGEDLAQRMSGGAMPIDEALLIAREIADALEAAHEHGIVHRDLKPANVRVKLDGTAKVLDFGLAKVAEPAAAGLADTANSPTFTSPAMTQLGVILGTAAYMAPEQARGRPADRRSDMWAFGVLLYEMLTGRRAYAGETVTDVLAAIVTRDPDWTALPPDTPPAVVRLLRRCLTRDPRRRLGDAGEARAQIEEIIESAGSPVVPARVSSPRRKLVTALPWAVTILALIALAFAWRPRGPQVIGREAIRYSIDVPAKTSLALTERPTLALSPDGRSVAFTAASGGVTRLYLRTQRDFEARALAGSEGASEPVFSPDGRWIAFFANSRLCRMPVQGGPVEALAAVTNPRGVSWDSDDVITYSPLGNGPVFQIPASGGTPTAVTKLVAPAERSHRWGQALPGNKAVLFTVGTYASPDNYDGSSIEAVTLATGERRVLLKGAARARFVQPGYLIFGRGRMLFGVRFDADRLEVRGTPAPLIDGVDGDLTSGAIHFETAAAGTLVYVPVASDAVRHRVFWIDRAGQADPLTLEPGAYYDLRLSPDGRRVALRVEASGGSDIWVHDIARSTFTRLTSGGTNRTPVWSRDGAAVYYVALATDGTSASAIMRAPADGSREAGRLASTGYGLFLKDVREQDATAIVDIAGTNMTDVASIRLDHSATVTPLVASSTDEVCGALSPDGRWLAYHTFDSLRPEVYVREMSGRGAKWQISTTGGEEPRWSPNGRELFYRNDTVMMSVPIQTQPTFEAGPPTVLFDGVYNLRSDSQVSYDVAAKGGRFLMIRPADGTAAPRAIRLITNWADEALASIK